MSTFVLPTTSLFASINIAILVLMAFAVVHQRISHQVPLGSGGVERLERAVRAHGNLAEYMPSTLILMALLEFNSLPAWQLHVLGGVFTAARLSHIHGIMTSTALTRTIGALFTVIIMVSMIGRLAVLLISG